MAQESDLDERERARARRFLSQTSRSGFVARRWFLRLTLSSYAGISPGSISFRCGKRGKPALGAESGPASLQFSASSSGPFVIYAVTMGREVGVDLERLEVFDGMCRFASRFFSLQERRVFQSADGYAKTRLFYQIWTAKEAYLKGTGDGLSGDPRKVSAIPSSNMFSSVDIFSDGAWVRSPWLIRRFEPEKGLVGCVAVRM